MGKAQNLHKTSAWAGAIALSFLAFLNPLALAQEEESGGVQTHILNTSSVIKERPYSLRRELKQSRRNAAAPQSGSVKYKQGVPCVPLMLVDDPNTLILTERDANLKAEGRHISLERGKGVYIVGAKTLTVETPLCTITLAGNSAAIIEESENGTLRLDHLTGPASTVSVKRWKGSRTYTADSGREILIAPKQVPGSVGNDGIERQELSSELREDGTRISENKFAPKSMLDKECLLQCDSSSFFQVRNRVYHLRNSLDQNQNQNEHNASPEDSMPVLLLSDKDEDSRISPVTFSRTVQEQSPLVSKESESAILKFNSGTQLSFANPAVTQLRSGELLLSAKKLSFVKTPDSMVRVEAGTIALISVIDGVSKVRNLWENSRHGLSQCADGRKFELAAGDESLLAGELRSIYISASKDMIGRRLTHYNSLPDGSVIHFAEISLISLAQGSDLLCQVLAGSSESDREIAHKINKMAAILVQISASHGMYELTRPPQWKRDARAAGSDSSS